MVPISIPMPETKTIPRPNPEILTSALMWWCPERDEDLSGSNGKNQIIMTPWISSKSGKRLQQEEPAEKEADSGTKRVQEGEGLKRTTGGGEETLRRNLQIPEGLI